MLLPTGNTLTTQTGFDEYPTRTWRAENGGIVGFCDELDAMRQAVVIALAVRRYYWQIYTPNFGTIFDDLLGKETGYVQSEIVRRVQDALSTDSRVLAAEDFSFTQQGGALAVDFTVRTVYGSLAGAVRLGAV